MLWRSFDGSNIKNGFKFIPRSTHILFSSDILYVRQGSCILTHCLLTVSNLGLIEKFVCRQHHHYIIFYHEVNQSGLFRSQPSRRLVVSSVVVQVVVFLLDDNLEVV
jgi:hypothetical protein